MKLSYDLHIHSCLSACADELQTPNNIMNMCMLKELDIVAVTDHNSLKQMPVFHQLAISYDFLFIYGVEVTVQEGFHVLVYFEHLEQAMRFDRYLENNNPKRMLDNPHLQKQMLYNVLDEEVGSIDYNLQMPIQVGCVDLVKAAKKENGVVVLAHIDRKANGALAYHPNINQYGADGVEWKMETSLAHIQYPHLRNLPWLHSSDAHTLNAIFERQSYMEIKEKSFQAFRAYFGAQDE